MIADFTVGPFILMYHSIADHPGDPYSVPATAFREQVGWLSENGFQVVQLSFLLRAVLARNYRILRRKVVITFDDGYQDFVTEALPVLLAGGVPATVFLVTDLLGGRASWNESAPRAPLMSESEARFIKAQGISLGSHSATHANLTLLGPEELGRQLRDSRDRLTSLGESFCAFSYPWGQWSRRTVDAVKAAGYECALAVGEKLPVSAANSYLLPRIAMRRDLGLKRFQSLLQRTGVELELRRRWAALRSRQGAWTKNPAAVK